MTIHDDKPSPDSPKRLQQTRIPPPVSGLSAFEPPTSITYPPQLQTDTAKLETENEALTERIRSVELDKAMLLHELGTVNLERHGWGLERERVGRELWELREERDELVRRVGALEEEVRTVKERQLSARDDTMHERQQTHQIQASNIIDVDDDSAVIRAERDNALTSLVASKAREDALQLQINGLLNEMVAEKPPRKPRKPRQTARCVTAVIHSDDDDFLRTAKASSRQAKARKTVVVSGDTTEEEDYITSRRGSGAATVIKEGTHVHSSAHPASRLTREIHTTIAGFLAGDNAYRSLAHYTSVNRSLRQSLLPTLYETVILDDRTEALFGYWKSKVGSRDGWFASGFQHTKYIFTSRNHHNRLTTIARENYRRVKGDRKPLTKLVAVFPNLLFHVTWDERIAGERAKRGEYDVLMEIWGVVKSRAFHRLLRHVRVAFENRPAAPIDAINTVRCAFKTGIVHGHLVPPAQRYRNRTADDLTLHLPQLGVRLTETLDDLLRMLPREKQGGDDRRVAVILPKMRMPTFGCLRKRLAVLFVDAPYSIRIEGTMHKPDPKGVATAGSHLPKLIEAFQRIWTKIPLANRSSVSASDEPMYKMVVPVNRDGLKTATFTICPFEDGEGFVADMEARDGEGNVVNVPKSKYPIVWSSRDGGGGEDSDKTDSGSEYQLLDDSEGEM